MAIYHLNTQAISRGQGRSVVACAAYRSGEKLHDERQGRTHDYTRKADVAHREILLPLKAPDWMTDREQLWNHVEALEKRKDARLAREVQFSLLRELTLDQNKELARAFVQQTFVDQGMVADLSIHIDEGSDGVCQPHAHVLLATRCVDEQGFGLKNADWNKKEQLLDWREAWATLANQHLALHGHDVQIDHRSYKDQEIDLEPQHKKGPIAAPQQADRCADHQRIARENGEKMEHDPTIALNALTRQQSTFTPQDLARFINRHSDTPEQFQRISIQIYASAHLVRLGTDDKGRERLTTREMLDLEQRMLDHTISLQERPQHKVRESHVQQALSTRTLSEEQSTALHALTAAGDLKCLVGYAGTGKSYLLSAAREAWEASGYRVRGVALSGIATQSLIQSSGIESRTVASLVYSWNQGRDRLNARDVLVIDEAGMLGSRPLARLIQEAERGGAKVVLIGDHQQLQAIEAGAAFRAIAQQVSYTELTDIRRQRVEWQREATADLAQGQVTKALQAYDAQDHLHRFDTQDQAKERLMDQWNDVRRTNPEQSQLLLAYTRLEVKDLNDRARTLMRQDGDLGIDYTIETDRGWRDFAAGDRVYFLKRNNELGVINGTLGTIRAIDDRTQQLTIDIEDDPPRASPRQVRVDPTLYNHLDHGYAATVYKAQGVTVDRSYLLASTYDDAHSTYVGLSRHRESCDVYASAEVFKDDQDLFQTLSRHRHKDVTLDYSQPEQDYAAHRTIEPLARVEGLTDLAQRFQQNVDTYRQEGKDMVERYAQQQEAAFDQRCADFQARIRREYPAQARVIEDRVMSPVEKQGQDYVQLSHTYAQERQHHPLTDRQKEAFLKQTQEVAASPDVMGYLQCHHPHIKRVLEAALTEAQRQQEKVKAQTPAQTQIQPQRQRESDDHDRGYSR